MWLYSVTRLAVICPTFLMAQLTLLFVVLPGRMFAANPHFWLTQLMLSSSLPLTVTRSSFRPPPPHPSSTK